MAMNSLEKKRDDQNIDIVDDKADNDSDLSTNEN